MKFGVTKGDDNIFTISLLCGKTLKIDLLGEMISIWDNYDLIEEVAKQLDVYPFQISLYQDNEIISNDKLIEIDDIKNDLTCIIKPPTLYVYYKFVCESGCCGGDGEGSIYVSPEEPLSDKYDEGDCYILEPGMCLHYKRIQNKQASCCSGFLHYTDYLVGLMSDSNFVITYDNDEYPDDEFEITQCILSYDDAVKTLNNRDQKVDY